MARALLAELVAALKDDPVLRRDVSALFQVSGALRADDRLMTVAEVAAVLEVSERSVYRALRDGRLRGSRIGSSWRISSMAVDDWKGERRRSTTAGRPASRRSGSHEVARRAVAA